MSVKISLCIPTKNRFDNFLTRYIDDYLTYLKQGIIDEIVICDETGSDFDKINNKYSDYIQNNTNFKIIKNDNILGVFENKLKVCSYASNEYIALIDSDNFADENYFNTVTNYIMNNSNNFSKNLILAPSFAKPRFNYKEFETNIVDKTNIKNYAYNNLFQVVLNTGNYVLTKSIINTLQYDNTIMNVISACDVLYFNLLAFQQYPDLQFHIVTNLEYLHVVHDDSEYLKTHHNCDNYRDTYIIPKYKEL